MISKLEIDLDLGDYPMSAGDGIGVVQSRGEGCLSMVIMWPEGPKWLTMSISEREELIAALIKMRDMDEEPS